MLSEKFFKKKGPFPLNEIAKVINNNSDTSKFSNTKIYGISSLSQAQNTEITFLNST